jgi:hypothetical protein
MTELERKTKVIPPTSFEKVFTPAEKNIETILSEVIKYFELSGEDVSKIKQGSSMEKFSKSNTMKMCLETIVNVIDNAPKPASATKNEEMIYMQNKKAVKDLVFSAFGVVNNYPYNDKELKLLLIGKLLQSLHGN